LESNRRTLWAGFGTRFAHFAYKGDPRHQQGGGGIFGPTSDGGDAGFGETSRSVSVGGGTVAGADMRTASVSAVEVSEGGMLSPSLSMISPVGNVGPERSAADESSLGSLLAMGSTSVEEAGLGGGSSHSFAPAHSAELGSRSASPSTDTQSDAQVAELVSMGFAPAQARRALVQSGGSVEHAADILLS